MGETMQRQTVEIIQEFIKQKMIEAGIVNPIVRDDVFAILENECHVLYFALDDEVDGCHICKPMNGEMAQFVYINTFKVLQEQVWTAAHELGHVWSVDQYVKNHVFDCDAETEELVGRFAAEFLIPEQIFRRESKIRLHAQGYVGGNLSTKLMMDLVTYLMNYFCVPAKAVIIRMAELGNITEGAIDAYLNGFAKNEALYHQMIQENQYTRLDKRENVYKMGNLKRDLEYLEEKNAINEKYAQTIRVKLHFDGEKASDAGLEYRG